jgi:hypothetical protein
MRRFPGSLVIPEQEECLEPSSTTEPPTNVSRPPPVPMGSLSDTPTASDRPPASVFAGIGLEPPVETLTPFLGVGLACPSEHMRALHPQGRKGTVTVVTTYNGWRRHQVPISEFADEATRLVGQTDAYVSLDGSRSGRREADATRPPPIELYWQCPLVSGRAPRFCRARS